MAVNNHLMDNWILMLKIFRIQNCLFLDISAGQRSAWDIHGPHLCLIPVSKSFLISNGPFSDCSSLVPIPDSVLFLFNSDPGFSSLQYLPLSFRRNSSNISSKRLQDLQDLQKFFFCLKSLYTDNHSVSFSSLFLPLAINSFPGIIQITIISWSFFSLNREEELFVDPS